MMYYVDERAVDNFETEYNYLPYCWSYVSTRGQTAMVCWVALGERYLWTY